MFDLTIKKWLFHIEPENLSEFRKCKAYNRKIPRGKLIKMAIHSRKIFKVQKYLGRLSSFLQFPEITPLFASRIFSNSTGIFGQKNRTGFQLHEGDKIFLTLDRKLVARCLNFKAVQLVQAIVSNCPVKLISTSFALA